MEHSTIIAYINVLLLLISIMIGIYSLHSNQKAVRLDPLIKEVTEKVFIAFQQTIGKKLFKKITRRNIQSIHSELINLKNTIENTSLEFSLSYLTTYYLDKLISTGSSTDKNNLKRYNYHFQRFSLFYFKDLNKFRKRIGLPKYSNSYRIDNRLYKNNLWYFFYHFKVFMLIILLGLITQIVLYQLLENFK